MNRYRLLMMGTTLILAVPWRSIALSVVCCACAGQQESKWCPSLTSDSGSSSSSYVVFWRVRRFLI